jgi:hypothetical protein
MLDLCSGAGLAAWGYALAGYEMTGVDNRPQPNYPFEFVQADALTYPLEGYDAYHCSAPCQLWSPSTLSQRKRGVVYPDLITPMRKRLIATGKPWVMENVPEAPLRPDLDLCGCYFRLKVKQGYLKRVRRFELSWQPRVVLPPHRHEGAAITIAGHGTTQWQRRLTGHVGVALWREIMGASWTTREELTEGIPPAYTAFTGMLLWEVTGD